MYSHAENFLTAYFKVFWTPTSKQMLIKNTFRIAVQCAHPELQWKVSIAVQCAHPELQWKVSMLSFGNLIMRIEIRFYTTMLSKFCQMRIEIRF